MILLVLIKAKHDNFWCKTRLWPFIIVVVKLQPMFPTFHSPRHGPSHGPRHGRKVRQCAVFDPGTVES